MKVEMAEIGVQLRRLTIISIRKSYRLICNHPFLVGIFLFLLFMYRSFPFLFSILVSTSPVVVCTFALLGFLLSLGDTNIPEIEKEESVNHEITSLRTEVQRDTTIVERDGSFVVERYAGNNTSNELESLIEEPISRDLGGSGPLIEDYFAEIKSERREIETIDSDLVSKNEETVFLENQYSRIEEMDEESVGLLDKSPLGSIGSVIAERGDSPPSSPWKQFGEGDDDVADDDEDEDSESDSDRAESSSPDASMADILPMLDELHPLLNQETPLATRGSNHGSDHGSNASESEDESENHEEERDEKGEEAKAEITWTEDDQKNLMDLGTLEIERNQRLESLIARRRARKLMVEKNLIDLNFENLDLPFSVTPISTTKKNPFDLAHDSNEFPGLPPIPGSAPSIMSQRRNPFDLPYDSSEEKPDLTDDNFQEEFSPLPMRESRFRRHESFNVGPSIFAPPKRVRDDFRFRPYFVPEGSSHSTFQRQWSELSDVSKISSVPETESICSNVDQDDKKVLEEDISPDLERGSDLVQDPSELVGHGSESSDDDEVIELGQQDEKEIDHENSPKGEIDHVDCPRGETDHDEVEIPSSSLSRTLSTIEEDRRSSGSSSSSLSEEHERAFNEKKDEVSSSFEVDTDQVNELADENKEPVYDLSPSPSINKMSFLIVDQISEMDKTVVSFSDREIDFCTQKLEFGSNESGTSGDNMKAEPILGHGLMENHEKLNILEDQDQSNKHEEDHVDALVQGELIEKHSISEDQIHSSSSNVHSRSVSVENPMDEQHFLDKLMADLSAKDPEELLEPSTMQESIAENQNEGNALKSDQNLDQVRSQTLDSQNKPSSFHVHESYLPEGDEIKEIDEWILELENVGDFSIGKLRSSSNEMPLVEARSVEDIEAILLRNEPVPMIKLEAEELQFEKTEAESIQIGAKNETTDSRMHELVAASIQDIKTAFKQMNDEQIQSLQEKSEADLANESVFEPVHDDEVGSGMHELEATSILDIDTAFRQISEENIESIPDKSEADVAEISEETENKTVFEPIPDNKIDSGLHELEATSIQDIDTAFRQINDKEIESFPEKSEADVAEISEETDSKTVFKPIPVNKIDSGLHELEASSIQDIDTAFRQIKAEEIIDSLDAEISEETENRTDFEPIPDNEIDSGMHELEATSIQDIDAVFKQFNDEEIKKSIIVESLEAKPWPEEIEADVAEIGKETANKIVSEPTHSDEIDSGLHELEATSIEDIDTAFRQINDQEIEALSEKTEADAARIHKETEIEAVFESIHDDEIDSAMHELEATSIQDIDTAFRQIKDEEIESFEEKIEARVAEISEETENKTISEPTHLDEIDSGLHELEATSIQDIDTAFCKINDQEIAPLPEKIDVEVAKIHEETEVEAVFESIHEDEIDAELHEVEATSIQDIDTALRQIKDEEIESFPEKSEAQGETENKITFEPIHDDEIEYGLHELEATSIQDIDTAFRQFDDQEIVAVPEKFETEVARIQEETEVEAAFESIHKNEIDSAMHELEATSIQDIDAAFKQINNEALERPLIVDSADAESVPEKADADLVEIRKEIEDETVFEPNPDDEIVSEMHEFEATSVEDIDSVFRRIKEEEIKNPAILESQDAESLPGKVEAEVSSIDASETPIFEARSIEKHNNIERFVTAVSDDFEPYFLEAEDKTEEIYSGKHKLDSTSVREIDETFSHINELEDSVALDPIQAGKTASQNEMPFVEARSIEDIDLAFVKVDNPENDKSNIIEAEDQAEDISSTIVELDEKSVQDNEAISQIKELDNRAVHEDMDSGMKEFEARSLEDLNSAFKKIDEVTETSVTQTNLVPEKGNIGVSELENPELPESENNDFTKVEDQVEEISSPLLEHDELLIKESDATSSSIKEDEKPAYFAPIPAETIDFETDLIAQSPEDIDLTLRNNINDEIENPVVVASLTADLAPEKSDAEVPEIGTQEMPVVEASSTEDIVLALKQVHEKEENRNLISKINKTEDKEEDIDSKMVKDDAASNVVNEVETVDLELKDFESRSIEDISLSLRDIEKEKEVEKPVNIASLISDLATAKRETGVSKMEAEDQVSAFEPVHAEETASEMKELEAQSFNDIELAFKQFTEKETKKPAVIESLKAETIAEKAEAEISEAKVELPVDEPSIETADTSETYILQVESEIKPKSVDNDTLNIEAKSQDETDNLENQLNSNFEDGSVGTNSKDVLLSEEAETNIKDPAKAETSGDFSKADSDNISSGLSDTKA